MSPSPNEIDDRLARALGIPAFGLSIPHLAGLFGPLGPGDVWFWVGTLAFVVLAGTIWQGNLWLLYRQRERMDWLSQPLGKVAFIVVGCVFYTAPVTALFIGGWQLLAGLPVDDIAIRTTVLINVISVLFVTHVYETTFLVKARHQDVARVAQLERAQVQAELTALRAQIDPHFLFNSLNTLQWLTTEDPQAASEFTGRLAQVYRYILTHRERELVQLTDELAFFDDCFRLLEVRFAGALTLKRPSWPAERVDQLLLPPISLQVLLENAVKHNRFSAQNPLCIELRLEHDHIEVDNPLRPRADSQGTGVGLANLAERYRLALDRDVEICDQHGRFTVSLPLVRVG